MSDKAAVVFIFEQPQKHETFGAIAERAKSLFTDVKGMKVYAAVGDAAEEVSNFFESERQSNLVDHARRELARLNNDEDFNNSIIASVRAFASYGHSGGSASVAIPVLHQLLQFKPLTPLTNDPKEWNEVDNEMWQSNRDSEAFSKDRGMTYYLLSEPDGLTHVSEAAE